jgi:hypothetical protein
VELDDVLHERQTKTKAPVKAGRRAVFLPECFEDVGQDVRADAGARISDDQVHIQTGPHQRDVDMSARRGELHGIRKQIPNDLMQPIRRSLNGQHVGFYDNGNSNPLRSSCGTNGLHGVLDDAREIAPFERQSHAAGGDPAEIEKIVDQMAQRTEVSVNDIQGMPLSGFVECPRPEHPNVPVKRRQRRTELVGHRGEELILCPACRLGGFARLPFANQKAIALVLEPAPL